LAGKPPRTQAHAGSHDYLGFPEKANKNNFMGTNVMSEADFERAEDSVSEYVYYSEEDQDAVETGDEEITPKKVENEFGFEP
jgi:hypothetical protein